MARRFRQINFIRTDTLEGKIALATAKRDYAAIEVWQEVARVTGAPIRQAEIDKLVEQYKAVLK